MAYLYVFLGAGAGGALRHGVNLLAARLLGTGFPFKEVGHIDEYLRMLKNVMKTCSGVRRPGAASIDLASVASGRFDAFWENRLSPWDFAAGMLLVGASSDRHGERVLHAAACAAVVSAGALGAALFDDPVMRVVCIAIMQIAVTSFLAPFWCIPSLLLSGSSAAPRDTWCSTSRAATTRSASRWRRRFWNTASRARGGAPRRTPN